MTPTEQVAARRQASELRREIKQHRDEIKRLSGERNAIMAEAGLTRTRKRRENETDGAEG